MNDHPRAAPDAASVVGHAELAAKRSAVDAQGALKNLPIDGLLFRPTRPVPHEDGYLTEVARASWGELAAPIVQVHVTTTLAGRVRAWGLHQRLTDRLFVVGGLVKIVVFDGRVGSPTAGRINEFTVSERNPGLLVIPPNLYHGWKNIGTSEAIIIKHAGPDVRLRQPGCARPAVGLRGGATDRAVSVVGRRSRFDIWSHFLRRTGGHFS